MHLLLALALAAPAGGPAARAASLESSRYLVTLGEPRVISVETPHGWTEPGPGVVPPVPAFPARLEVAVPAHRLGGRGPRLLESI